MLHITNHSSFRNRSKRQDISDHQIGFFTTKHELTGVHPLGGNEEFLLVLVTERMTEGDASKRRTAAWIVDDLGDDSFEVTVAFAEVEAPESGWTFAVVCVGFEDGACSLTLCSDNTSHY
ncbi:hypothetical protein Hanom_Chr05g00466651 [Helianthus anomalus]